MPKLKRDQDTAELRVSMTLNPPSLTQEQELFVTSTNSFTEVTFVPLYPAFTLAYSFAAKLAGKHPAMPLSSSGVFAVGQSRRELAVKGRRQCTGLASGTLVNCKNFQETTVCKLHGLGTLARFRLANTFLT